MVQCFRCQLKTVPQPVGISANIQVLNQLLTLVHYNVIN